MLTIANCVLLHNYQTDSLIAFQYIHMIANLMVLFYRSSKSNLPRCSNDILETLKDLFLKLQPYQASLKVGYEAR